MTSLSHSVQHVSMAVEMVCALAGLVAIHPPNKPFGVAVACTCQRPAESADKCT